MLDSAGGGSLRLVFLWEGSTRIDLVLCCCVVICVFSGDWWVIVVAWGDFLGFGFRVSQCWGGGGKGVCWELTLLEFGLAV